MWWDILKNIQIGSQRTSSRDYAIEDNDDDCKRRFLAVYNKVENLEIEEFEKESKDGFWTKAVFHNAKRWAEDEEAGIVQWEFYDLVSWLLFDETVPDEIYCYAIQQYENTPFNDTVLDDYGDYRILTDKADLGTTRGSEEGYNYDTLKYDISIYLKDSLNEGPKSSITLHHKVFYNGKYGDEGKRNPELDSKIEKIIKGLLAF